MQAPRKSHLAVAKCILWYVKPMLHYRLFYEFKREIELYGYTNANKIGSILDRRSTSGFMFSLRSGVVSWSSKK